MKNLKPILAIVLLSASIAVAPVDNLQTNAGTVLPLSFQTAQAWNLGVKEVHTLTEVASVRAALSRDFRSVIYVTVQPFPTSLYNVPDNPQTFLIVRSLDSWQISDQFKLPVGPGGDLACSPDGKKVVYGPTSSQNTGLLFIDLDTHKITTVALATNIEADNLYWPNPTNVYLAPSYCIDLDSLAVSILPETLLVAARENNRTLNEKTFTLDISTKYNVPGYSGPNISVSSVVLQ